MRASLCLALVICCGSVWCATSGIEKLPASDTAVRALGPNEIKLRAARQAQNPFQPQFVPQMPQCLPAPTPFEGKACTSTSECDGSNTVLSCERGTCTCPKRPTQKWVRGPYDLNTQWDAELKKCVSLKDSACDIYKPKTVFCQKGLVCHEKMKKYGFGLCSTNAANRPAITITINTLMFGFSILSLTLFNC